MKENAITNELRKYVLQFPEQFPENLVFEAKLVKSKAQTFRFAQENPSRRKKFEEQIEKLCDLKSRGLFYKPSDALGITYTLTKPADGIWIKNPRCYIVIYFYISRKRKVACFFEVDTYKSIEKRYWKLKNGSKTSLSYEDVKTLCDFLIDM